MDKVSPSTPWSTEIKENVYAFLAYIHSPIKILFWK
jgi:hypothetical protein